LFASDSGILIPDVRAGHYTNDFFAHYDIDSRELGEKLMNVGYIWMVEWETNVRDWLFDGLLG